MRKFHPSNCRSMVYAMRIESAGGPHRFRCTLEGTASPEGHRQKTGSSTYNVHRVVDLGQGSEPTCEAAPSNLGLTQFTRFFPVPANVFQIQSLFVPTHEALLVRWPFRSNHSAYLRGKMRHLLCPQSVVNGCLAGFPRRRNAEPLIRGKRSIRQNVQKYY